jgi:hypothetical protein
LGNPIYIGRLHNFPTVTTQRFEMVFVGLDHQQIVRLGHSHQRRGAQKEKQTHAGA